MRQQVWLVGSIMILALLALATQSMTFLNADVSCEINEAMLLLKGGNYATDFYETNPPTILYLLMPILVLAKLFSINMMLTARIYIISFALFSAAICFFLLKNIFHKEDRVLIYGQLFTLLFIFLFMPAIEFGQREHFFMMLFFPYVYSSVLIAQGKKNPFWLSILIGLMAGVGISMKPFFLVPLLLIEFYLFFLKQHLLSWARVETMVCALTIGASVLSIYIFQPNYYFVILPLVSQFYFSGMSDSLWYTVTDIGVIWCFFVFGYYLFFYKNQKYHEFVEVLILSLVGLMLAFLIPKSSWFYHVIPAFGMGCLLSTFFIFQAFKNKLTSIDIITMLLTYFIVLFIPIISMLFYFFAGYMRKNDASLNQVISYVSSSPAKSVYCFSANTTNDCFPMVLNLNKEFGGRSPFFWWMIGMRRWDSSQHIPLIVQKNKIELIEGVSEDLNHFKTDLIVIHVKNQKRSLGKNGFINYLSQNEKFKNEWKNYHLVNQFGVYQIYERDRS